MCVPFLSFPDAVALPFYKSHGKSVPVAVMPSVIRKGTRERKRKRTRRRRRSRRKKKTKKEKDEHTREKFYRIVIEAPREPFWAGRVYQSGDNRAQFLGSLLWSGFTPSSSLFLPPSSPLTPGHVGRGRKPHPAAATR